MFPMLKVRKLHLQSGGFFINCQKETNHMQNVVEEYFQPYVTCSWWDMRRWFDSFFIEKKIIIEFFCDIYLCRYITRVIYIYSSARTDNQWIAILVCWASKLCSERRPAKLIFRGDKNSRPKQTNQAHCLLVFTW